MAVYVDDMRAPFGRMIMCHMIADTYEELMDMAQQIKVSARWIQYPGTYKEHFDICLSMRARAVELGAIEIEWEQLGCMEAQRKHGLPMDPSTAVQFVRTQQMVSRAMRAAAEVFED